MSQTDEPLRRRIAELERQLEEVTAQVRGMRVFRAMIEQSWDVTWLIDPDGRVRYVSPSRFATGGTPLPAPVGELSVADVIERMHPDDRAKARAAFDRALAAPPNQPIFLETREFETDRIREVVALNRLDDPDLRGVLVVSHDIGEMNEPRRERDIAQRSLRDSERRFRALFEATSAAVTIRDVDRQAFLDCNDAALRLYAAKTRDELRETKPNDLAPENQPDGTPSRVALRAAVERAATAGSWHGEWQGRRLNGEIFAAHIRISRIDLETGPIFQSVIEDVTDFKRVEEALARAKEEALRASRAKSDFLMTMSHELRSPLNGVIGMVDLMAATSFDERQKRYADVARASAHALLSVINDVLDISKIEAGKFEACIVDFTWQDVVDEAACIFGLAAEEKGIALFCRVDTSLRARVLGDAARIRQVVVNLIGNAMKFTARGHVLVHARAIESTAEAVVVRLEVQDTGVGIAPNDVDRVFTPFTQLEGHGHGGAGLGLAICRELTQLMGGTIGVESETGKGSTFWLELRLAWADGLEPPPPILAGAPRVLVVSSREAVVHLLTTCLAERGAQTTVAMTMDEAHRKLAEERHAVAIIVDDTPDLDARALVARIATDGRLQNTKLLFVESLRRPLDDLELGTARPAARCPKPIWSGRLETVLGELLGGHEVVLKRPANVVASPPRARVLVVDDSALNAEVTKEILRSSGYDVVIAPSGEDALFLLMRHPFDFVLLDCQLPGIDGYETARRVRALERDGKLLGSRGLPIVALTASATSEDRERAVAAGMNDYLSKPVEASRLLSMVARLKSAEGAFPARTFEDASASSVDLSRTLSRFGGDLALVRKAARQFRELAPASWDLMRAAIVRRDAAAVRFAAHRLRGQALTFDAGRLAHAVRAIEAISDPPRWDAIDATVGRVHAELDEVLSALASAER